MHANTQVVQYAEELLVENDRGPWQRLQFMLREELRLIVSVALKLGAALLILEALAWIAAESNHGGDRGASDAVTASATRSPVANSANTANTAGSRQLDNVRRPATP
jgi:hypothetical protein